MRRVLRRLHILNVLFYTFSIVFLLCNGFVLSLGHMQLLKMVKLCETCGYFLVSAPWTRVDRSSNFIKMARAIWLKVAPLAGQRMF